MFTAAKERANKSQKRQTRLRSQSVGLPKKMIKAMSDYQAQGPNELSFRKGDSFYLLRDHHSWLEVTNDQDQGIVPASYFKAIDKRHPIYGVVLYDFRAERPDELEAGQGEAIVVMAQVEDWFVAKPIGRLGGPGLIPVSFVEIRDVLTGEPVPFELPRWVGPLEGARKDARVQVDFVSVDSYLQEGGRFWFVLYVHLEFNQHRILYRLYEDFYDFQLKLLELFPVEAGKADQDRILPFMPGPVTYVDEKVTSERQSELDRYCKALLKLPRYISESELVQERLFGLRDGDMELDYDPRISNVDTEQVKIKIVFKDDMFAIKVAKNCSLNGLKTKVFERIQTVVKLKYKNESSQTDEPLESELDMENAFIQAIKKGKLTVIASV